MSAVVLDAAALRRAAGQPGAVAAFPFLRPLVAPVKPGCCGQAARAPDVKTVIDAVTYLPPDRLAAFKSLLGATTLIVWRVRALRTVKLEL
jgi:hypothetical protein